jgi:hypothetical protein
MRRYGRKPHHLFYFWIVVKAVSSHCFFSIREVASAAIIAGDTQAMTGVSEMAQKLMSTCEGAMTTISCANTESDEHDTATAAFDEAASKLEELGFVHEITLDGVAFSRSEPDAGEYDPGTKIAAA